ncbi:MAG: GNAT family N-acetyltransferase [Pseudonocardiaceae bacterium]
MHFRWDWLSPVVRVPYVPTLGPVHPRALSAELFGAVVDVAGTGRFLPYDKDRRWSSTKDEQIAGGIIHKPGLTIIPTLSTCGHRMVKIYHYGESPPRTGETVEWSRTWSAAFGKARGRVIWFQDTPDGASTRLMLKTFGDQDKRKRDNVMELEDCDVADTFPTFADQPGIAGFSFLQQRMKAGLSDGPILVTVEDRRIVGAVGPLGTLTDATGTRMQPPQYFAVHPSYRRKGHGRALWRAAMAWGAENGAEYKVLQAASGSPSELLYLSEGLSTLGFLCEQELAAPTPLAEKFDDHGY